MNFALRRINSDGLSTRGELFQNPNTRLCDTLERGPRNPDHPRIVSGRHPMVLRTEGGKHAEYLVHYGPDFHKGIVQIIVPDRTFIEFHVANQYHELLGCIAPGDSWVRPDCAKSEHYQVVSSRAAYERVYPILRDAILANETFLDVFDSAM